MQQVAGASKTTSPFTCVFSSNVASGDLLTVSFTYYSSTLPSVSSVADSRGRLLQRRGDRWRDNRLDCAHRRLRVCRLCRRLGRRHDNGHPQRSTDGGLCDMQRMERRGERYGRPSGTQLRHGHHEPADARRHLIHPQSRRPGLRVHRVHVLREHGHDYVQHAYLHSGHGEGNRHRHDRRLYWDVQLPLNEADEYVLDWSSGSTTSTFSIAMGSNPTNLRTSGWAEIAVEFDPPAAASAGPTGLALTHTLANTSSLARDESTGYASQAILPLGTTGLLFVSLFSWGQDRGVRARSIRTRRSNLLGVIRTQLSS